jgi:hypothetical protein
MSDEQAPPPRPAHFNAAKVLIGEPYQVPVDEEKPNVTTIVRLVRIITANGQIWQQVVAGFGVLTELDVVKDWDRTYATDWTQVRPS